MSNLIKQFMVIIISIATGLSKGLSMLLGIHQVLSDFCGFSSVLPIKFCQFVPEL
jgi:hypothetical protein